MRRCRAPTHYENFPVASWLCPPRLRPPSRAIYGFARTADDIADEGDASAGRAAGRPARLSRRTRRSRARRGAARRAGPRCSVRSRTAMRDFALPEPLLADLLAAFMQDIEKTRDGDGYADRAELLDYCRRSANPIGRLLLHLYGVDDARAARAERRHLQRAAADQLLAGPERRPAARPLLPAAQPTAPRTAWRAQDFERFRPLAPAAPPPAAIALVRGEVRLGARADARRRAARAPAAGPRRLGAAPRRAGRPAHPRQDRGAGLRQLSRGARPSASRIACCLAWRALRMRRQSPAMTSSTHDARAVRPGQGCRFGQQLLLRLPVPAAPRRAAITAFYAFCREVDDVVDEVQRPRRRAHQARLVAHRGRRSPSPASRTIR